MNRVNREIDPLDFRHKSYHLVAQLIALKAGVEMYCDDKNGEAFYHDNMNDVFLFVGNIKDENVNISINFRNGHDEFKHVQEKTKKLKHAVKQIFD